MDFLSFVYIITLFGPDNKAGFTRERFFGFYDPALWLTAIYGGLSFTQAGGESNILIWIYSHLIQKIAV